MEMGVDVMGEGKSVIIRPHDSHMDRVRYDNAVQWVAREIDGVWCVGMVGDLECQADSILCITGAWLSQQAAQAIAESVADQHNAEIERVADEEAVTTNMDTLETIAMETKILDARLDVLFGNRTPISDYAKRRSLAKGTVIK